MGIRQISIKSAPGENCYSRELRFSKNLDATFKRCLSTKVNFELTNIAVHSQQPERIASR